MSECGQKGLMVPTRLLGWSLTKSTFFRHVGYWVGCHVFFWRAGVGERLKEDQLEICRTFPHLEKDLWYRILKLKAKANVSIPNRRKYLPIVQLFYK